MKETSWRTLMLLTTLLAVLVIFQATVRSPRLPAAHALPAHAVYPREDLNKLYDKVVCPRPEPVAAAAQAPPGELKDAPDELDKLQAKAARGQPEAAGAIAQPPLTVHDGTPCDPNVPHEPNEPSQFLPE